MLEYIHVLPSSNSLPQNCSYMDNLLSSSILSMHSLLHLHGGSIGCFDLSFLILSQLFRLMVFLFLPITSVFSICGGFSWARDRSGGGEAADGEEAARGGESARGGVSARRRESARGEYARGEYARGEYARGEYARGEYARGESARGGEDKRGGGGTAEEEGASS